MLENSRIRIRALEPEDLKLLYKWENDISSWKFSNTYIPFSNYTLKKYLENAHLDIFEAKQVRFVIDTNDLAKNLSIGFIDLFEYEPMHNRAGIGILIGDKEFRNKGYATSALGPIIDYAFQILGLHQLFCNISADNEKSLKLFQKLNFEITGKKREWNFDGNQWQDEFFLQLFREQ